MIKIGLDNGIIIKRYVDAKHKTFAMDRLFNKQENFQKETGDCEVLYWRKQWTYRNRIVDTLSEVCPNNGGHYYLNMEGIDVLISTLAMMVIFHEKPDQDFGFNFKENLQNLRELKHFMEFNPDAEVYFYDSY